jgi:osmoprotectant transport system ATP-binding protein
VGSTFDPETDTLRIALDAALTSPVSLAVAVNRASGRFAGVVSAQQILTQVAEVKGAQQESIALGAGDGDQAVETDLPSTADQPDVADGSAGSAAAAARAEADTDSSSDAYADSTGAGDGGAEERRPEERDLKSSELVSSEAADATSAAAETGELVSSEAADATSASAETDEQAALRYDGSDEAVRADPDVAGNVGDQDSAESDPAPESQQGIEDATPLEEHTGESQNSDEDTIVIAGVPVEIVPGGVIDNGQGSGSTDVHERDADRAEAPVR